MGTTAPVGGSAGNGDTSAAGDPGTTRSLRLPAIDRRDLAVFALFLVGYVAAARAGLYLAYPNSSVSAIWPATGVAIAGLLFAGNRFWPAVALGAFLANLAITGDPFTSAAIAGGNALEAVLGAYLAMRFAQGRRAVDTPEGVLTYSSLAVLPATAVSALVGTTTLTVAGLAAAGSFAELWGTWWIGDAIGGIVVGLVLLLAASSLQEARLQRPEAHAAAELAALIGASALAFVVVFGPPYAVPFDAGIHGTIFLVLPPMVWAAFRFGRVGAAGFTIALNVVALGATLAGAGAFASLPRGAALVALDLFLGTSSVTAFLVGAERYQRGNLLDDLNAARTNLQERVKERTAALDTAQAIGHVGTWELDLTTGRVAWSDEMYRIFGFGDERPAQTLETAFERIDPSDRAASRVRLREYAVSPPLDSRTAFQKLHVHWPDGTVRVIETAAQLLPSEGGAPRRMVGVVIDVTYREETLHRLGEREADLLRANRELEQFAYAASHDLQEPLGTMEGYARLLEQRYGARLDPEGVQFVRQLGTSASRMRALIDDVLELSRTGSGARAPQVVPMDGAFQEAVGRLTRAVEQGRAVIRADSTLPSVVGHREGLVRVWQNLLSNAIKFRGEDAPHISVRADVVDGMVRFAVRDNGIGVPTEYQGQVFDLFRRLHPRDRFEGNGLGLAICKKIIESEHGTIGVESTGRPGEGATFWFTLPRAPGPAA